jgi:hypothetical protein
VSCTLADYHDFSGAFSYGASFTVPLPTLNGFGLGSYHFSEGLAVTLAIDTSLSEVKATLSATFTLLDTPRSIGPFTLDLTASSIHDALDAIEHEILSLTGELFGELYGEAEQWARNVKGAVIAGIDTAENVAHGLHQAFGQDAKQIAGTMHTAEYDLGGVASGLRSVFPSSDGAVVKALKIAFDPKPKDLANALKGAGYDAKQVGNMLKSLGGDFANIGKKILSGLNPSHW